MSETVTWLHLSDLHFLGGNNSHDERARSKLLEYLTNIFKNSPLLRPDFVLCTGDIAFGETSGNPLERQYEMAKDFFNEVMLCCGLEGRYPHHTNKGMLQNRAQR